jgi:hypothetical protein
MIRVNCPCCGARDAVEVTIDEGQRYRPPSLHYDGDPEIPPSLDTIETGDCECYESGVVDERKYERAAFDAAMDKPQDYMVP